MHLLVTLIMLSGLAQAEEARTLGTIFRDADAVVYGTIHQHDLGNGQQSFTTIDLERSHWIKGSPSNNVKFQVNIAKLKGRAVASPQTDNLQRLKPGRTGVFFLHNDGEGRMSLMHGILTNKDGKVELQPNDFVELLQGKAH